MGGRTPDDGRSAKHFGARADEPVWLVGRTHIARGQDISLYAINVKRLSYGILVNLKFVDIRILF